MAEPIITKQQLVARLGLVQFTRVFDDNNDGAADKLSEEQIRKDASGKVRGALGLVYDAALLNADTSDELVRVTLDVAEAMATKRRPSILKGGDWVEMMKQADKDLEMLRKGVANLGITTAPEPAANHGVRITSGNPANPTCLPAKMSDNWGDF
jgi:phage gp36-like protein